MNISRLGTIIAALLLAFSSASSAFADGKIFRVPVGFNIADQVWG